MTEIEPRIRRKTPPVSSAQENPQQSKQTATPPLEATEKRQEPVVSQDTVRDSPTVRGKPQESKQTATPPLGATEKRQEPVVSQDSVRDSPTAREKPQEKERMATPPSGATEQRRESVVAEETVRDSAKTGALVHAAKAIEEGAELVGEKAPVLASIVFHSIKKGVSVAYETSSTLVGGAYHAASDYAEKYKHKIEVKKLNALREATSSRLGSIIYDKIVVEEALPEKAFADEEIRSLLQQIHDLDNEVVEIGKELDED
jgi:hypothetical protein